MPPGPGPRAAAAPAAAAAAAAAAGLSPLELASAEVAAAGSLLKFDRPKAAHDVRKPRALKLRGPGGPTSLLSTGKRDVSGAGDGRTTVPPVEDILNTVLPPLDLGDGTVRCVSADSATRLEVFQLQERLDGLLRQRQARDDGLCPVRSQLYTQTFDELIRQTTIECPERGLLLLRVRDEMRGLMGAQRALAATAGGFGNRAALVADDGLPELRSTVDRLDKEKRKLEVQALELQAKCEEIESTAAAKRAADEKVRAEEVNFFRKTNAQLAAQLKAEQDRANAKK